MYAEAQQVYYARLDPLRAVVVPIVGLEVVFTLGLFAGWEFCRRMRFHRVKVFHVLFLAGCLAPLGIASVAAIQAAPFNLTALVRSPWFWPAAFLAGVAPLVWVCRRPVQASRMARSALLYSWPVLLLVLVQAMRGSLLYPHSAYADGALAAPLHSVPRTRVVWIVFDELSQEIAFNNRPSGMALPNLDGLKQQSFYATAAESPADRTQLAMPSLILGEKVRYANPDGPDDLRIGLDARPAPVSWSSLPNVFDDVRDLGFDTALVGWFHPYGRVLNRSLTKCYWIAGWLPPGIEEASEPQSLAPAMWERIGMQLVAMPAIGHLPGVFPGKYNRREKISRLRFLDARAREIVTDPEIGLALIHLPIPHPPAIYDRARGTFRTQIPGSYLDDVVLVDRELGMLRRAMEEAGLWDRTAVLVTADHGWRTGMWRGSPEWMAEEEAASHRDTMGVPFLCKLPGRTAGLVYGKSFNTIATRRLIIGVLKGEITDSAAVAALIESRRW